MNCKCCGVWTLIALVIGMVLFFPAKAEEEETIMIVGTVVESDTDEDGKIIAINLETHAGTYAIGLRGKGIGLLSWVGHTVEIEEVLTEYDGEWGQVEVLSFYVVPDSI
jgi:hypothetical protein